MALLWILCAFALGSLPSGVIIARVFKGIDPRYAGSNNPGTTNVARLCGLPCGVATLVCDILKGLVPVALVLHYTPGQSWLHSAVALAAVYGHLKSPFLGFKGGKGVATSIGVLIPLAILPLLCAVALCLAAIGRSRYVSLGALTLVTSLPLFYLLFGRADLVPLGLIMAGTVYWTHRANIQRLAQGKEKSWKKSDNPG